ncbi:MAG: serine/threonine-protein kinase [Planctomycetota bacterium]
MPESVGPYRILERIGGGGMGEVYRAEQRAPIRRQVALKFIKLGMDTKAVLARFEAERQALALMDHPHIAKVFDAGTDDTGRPYFVMEYVKGKPITDYADQNHLTIRERLELFEQVCQAIQHAHHKGVIHRDLKPGNVLVSTQDDRPFAKVIDFGIAKAIAQRLTDETLFTQHDQFLGTPQYMSPEQAEGSVDIDTRTDVYSLGVLLYELLTGSTPFSTQDLRAAAFEQLKKLIIEVDPPKPSTRLTLNQPTLSTLAASRRTEPKRLGTLVQGELDWIVMKSLEKDRKRRYETPISLANDIQAHLQGEPVQAAPPSTAYRIQKFVRKHRGPVVAVTVIGLVLLLGIIGTSWGFVRAERNAERERQAKESESIAKQDANTQRDAAMHARKQAVAAQDQAEGALARGFVRPLVGEDVLTTYAIARFKNTSPEIEALWELATLESDTVGLRMLDEATRDAFMTEQLVNCAEPALVAAIGLNLDLRQRALTLLRPRLNDPALTLDHRAGIAWIMLMLLDKPEPDSTVCVTIIKEAMAANTTSPTTAQTYLDNQPDRVAALLEPSTAVALLLARLSDRAFWFDPEIAEAIAASSVRMKLDVAATACESTSKLLLAALSEPKQDAYTLSKLAKALSVLSARLEESTAAQACATASDILLTLLVDRDRTYYERIQVANPLVVLLSRLEPVAAERIADGLLAALPDTQEDRLEIDLFNSLAAVSTRLESTTAARVCTSASDRLLVLLAESNGDHQLHLAKALAALSARLEPDAASRVCESATGRLLAAFAESEESVGDLINLAEGLTALSSRLERETAARMCATPSNTLLAAFDDLKADGYKCRNLAKALVALSAHLKSDDAVRVCQSALDKVLSAWLLDDKFDHYLAEACYLLSVQLDSVAVKRTTPHAIRRLLSNPEHIWQVSLFSHHLAPQTRQSVLHALFTNRLVWPYEFSDGIEVDKSICTILSIMQRQEAHHAAVATPPDDKEAATDSTDHAFSTLKLTTAEIVEFLKSPLVQGDHRRAFLDLLECRYGRRFGNQWAFVEYAQAENLGLDFTTRVKRPDPKAILQNIRTLLDEEATTPDSQQSSQRDQPK